MSPLEAMGPRILLGIGVPVLLLHLALLQITPPNFSFDEPLQTKPFLTRSIFALPHAAEPSGVPAARIQAAPQAPETRAMNDSTAQARMVPLSPPAAVPLTAPTLPASAAVLASQAVEQDKASAPPVHPSGEVPVLQHVATNASAAEHSASPGASQRETPGETGLRPVAARVPASVKLKYRVLGEYLGISQSASADMSWLHDGQHYEARLSVGILFRTRVQTSRGSIGGTGLLPSRFSDKTSSERAAHFERNADGQGGKIVFSANSPGVPLSMGAQDRLSVLIQVGSLLAAEPLRYPTGSSLSMQVVSARGSDVWEFKVENTEMLDLPYGAMSTLKLTRIPRREYDQRVEIWLAIDMGYLPARVRITEPNGNFLDQQLSSMETP